MSNDDRLARLRWNCRRGMLELDIILGKFLNDCFVILPESDQDAFEKLLTSQDQELFDWLVQHQIPSDQATAHIIARILAHVSPAT